MASHVGSGTFNYCATRMALISPLKGDYCRGVWRTGHGSTWEASWQAVAREEDSVEGYRSAISSEVVTPRSTYTGLEPADLGVQHISNFSYGKRYTCIQEASRNERAVSRNFPVADRYLAI